MIRAKGIRKSFRNGEEQTEILKGIDLDIDDHDFVVILGPSGSGKSTLINCLSGLEQVDSGSICYDDTDMTKLKDKELTKFRRENLSYIFQAYYLMPSLNVESNVRMGANLAGIKDVSEYVEAVGLKGKEKKYPNQLSGGEQQRVSIARALAKKPKVLFCDEPTGALDEETGRSVLKYLVSLQQKEKFTIVMVTHNQNIADLANKVVRMNSGRIMEVVLNQPKTVDEIGW